MQSYICGKYLHNIFKFKFLNGHTVKLHCSIFTIVFSKYTRLNVSQTIPRIIQKYDCAFRLCMYHFLLYMMFFVLE